MRIHPIRAAKVQARKTEVARQKAVVEAIWTRDGNQCQRCGQVVMRQSPSARTVGRVQFEGPIEIVNGRLLCGLHFHHVILQ
jgi:hypothetical protein